MMRKQVRGGEMSLRAELNPEPNRSSPEQVAQDAFPLIACHGGLVELS